MSLGNDPDSIKPDASLKTTVRQVLARFEAAGL